MTPPRPDIMPDSRATQNVQPEWLRERLEWFQDLKFGLFMHWGPYCQWGCLESWPLVEADTWARPDNLKPWVERGKDLARFRRDYFALNCTFNPTRFDPAVWAEAAIRAGMKYVTFTTKHHDGFCMFDTRTTDYRVMHADCPFPSHPRANIAKHVFDTFRERGFGISCYFSKSDWHCPYYWCPDFPTPNRHVNYDTQACPDLWAKFVAFVHAQVEELMTGYGKMDVLWLDGGQVRPPKQDIQMPKLAGMARRHQPGLIVADRTVSGPYENILTPEQKILPAPLPQAWESCLTMGTSWSYKPGDQYKPTRTLIHMLVDIVAKGGNFLLNIGPDPDRQFAPEAMTRLREIADWMAVNGEAIHDTRPIAPYKEGNVCFTAKQGSVYAIVPAAEGETRAAVEQENCGVRELRNSLETHVPSTATLTGILPAPHSEVVLLGRKQPLRWRVSEGKAIVELPVGGAPGAHAWAIRFQPAVRKG